MAKKVAPKKKVAKVDHLKVVAEQHTNLELAVSVVKESLEKFQEGNVSAGRRMRKALQESKKIAQEMRKSIQEHINQSKS